MAEKRYGFSKNALRILKARYYMRDEAGGLIDTSPADLFRRAAEHAASAEDSERKRRNWSKRFFDLMINRTFLPNSPTLTGAGRGLCLSACFVIPIEDSMESIFDAVKNAALVHKEGGGTGFDFSRLRPEGSYVRKTQGVASGPVSFLKVIDAATEAVKQGGTRRGANMGILRVDHPDIEKFIQLKEEAGRAVNFNLSVAVTDEFMQAVRKNRKYKIYDPFTGKSAGKKDAAKIFSRIANAAWQGGDPGLIFIDRINALNPTREWGPIRATNPCGEQPLHDYESCNLGSINLTRFFDRRCGDEFNWSQFGEAVESGVRFLDNVIDVNVYPLPQIEKTTRLNRRIGLGVMGWADLLILKKCPYNSGDALDFGDKIASFLREKAQAASRKLGEERGSFPSIGQSVYKGGAMRNAAVCTIAPTGTISRIAGCSSGIEPVFAFEFTSRILDRELKDVHPLFRKWKKRHPDEPLPEYFVTAHDLTPEWHIKMQAAFQKHVDNSVSKTINFPNRASEKDIRQAYLSADEFKTKGITVYRDGSRAEQVLVKKEREERAPKGRPDSLSSVTDKIKTGFGNLYVTLSFFDGKPFEVFTSIGKSGYTTMADAEALGRLISLSLRSGIDPKEVIGQLKGIGGSEQVFTSGGLVQSIPDAIAKVLERHLGPGRSPTRDVFQMTCKNCGASLPDEKCPSCPNCGWNRCGEA
ncbi:MAG: adenosylcobalamin-dependent ribonucleoside-diphosphate reductase [Candidatus Aminicenantes bacterium]